jgi:hypothetical protein
LTWFQAKSFSDWRARKKCPGCLQKMCTTSIRWFLPWYSCYGRSDWALTDRWPILHEILCIQGFVRSDEWARARKPRLLEDALLTEAYRE